MFSLVIKYGAHVGVLTLLLAIGLAGCNLETTSTDKPFFTEDHPKAVQFIKPGHVLVSNALYIEDKPKFGDYYPFYYELNLKKGFSKTYESEHLDNIVFIKAAWADDDPEELKDCRSRLYDFNIDKSGFLIQATLKKTQKTFYLLAAEKKSKIAEMYGLRTATDEGKILALKDIYLDEFCYTFRYASSIRYKTVQQVRKYLGYHSDWRLEHISQLPKQLAVKAVAKSKTIAKGVEAADAAKQAQIIRESGIDPQFVANASTRYIARNCTNFRRIFDLSEAEAGGYAIIGAALGNFKTRGNACVASLNVGWEVSFTHMLEAVSNVRCNGSENEKKCRFKIHMSCRYEFDDTSPEGIRYGKLMYGNLCKMARIPTNVSGHLKKGSDDNWDIIGQLKVVGLKK